MISDAARKALVAANQRRGDGARRAIAGAVSDHWTLHGYAPSVREIQASCGISSSSVVSHHLAVMEREGVIARDPAVARSIRLTRR